MKTTSIREIPVTLHRAFYEFSISVKSRVIVMINSFKKKTQSTHLNGGHPSFLSSLEFLEFETFPFQA